MALFIPTYFSPISQYAAILASDKVTFEKHDNFQKQTYRNRCYIYSANGKQLLNIPVKHKTTTTGQRKKTKDTLVENDFPWQNQHFKSLQTAYRASPFFEFFEDDLAVIFNKKYKYLQDVNIDTHLFVCDALQLSEKFKVSDQYEVTPQEKDFRDLAIAKKSTDYKMEKYIQIFDKKYGFLSNLSILDLIFMEGANSLSFLEKKL